MSSVRSTSDGRGPVTRKRVPDREEPGKPRKDARRVRCHPLEAGFWPLWMTPLPRNCSHKSQDSGRWMSTTSEFMAQVSLAHSYPEPFWVTGPLSSIVLRIEDMCQRYNQCIEVGGALLMSTRGVRPQAPRFSRPFPISGVCETLWNTSF